MLDGLDELTEDKADSVLSYLHGLEKDDHIKKIVISCRTGNFNRLKVKTYFNHIIEYKIGELAENFVIKYFEGKAEPSKVRLLKKFNNKNPKLTQELKDILLIKLFWDTINELDENSTILDLLEKKVELLTRNPQYCKNIEGLNLLDPKEDKIIDINKDISYHFQKSFQFRFPQKEIQSYCHSLF